MDYTSVPEVMDLSSLEEFGRTIFRKQVHYPLEPIGCGGGSCIELPLMHGGQQAWNQKFLADSDVVYFNKDSGLIESYCKFVGNDVDLDQ